MERAAVKAAQAFSDVFLITVTQASTRDTESVNKAIFHLALLLTHIHALAQQLMVFPWGSTQYAFFLLSGLDKLGKKGGHCIINAESRALLYDILYEMILTRYDKMLYCVHFQRQNCP